jgi:uncharacterized membrane protein YdfJ with MMPL/SSD domain
MAGAADASGPKLFAALGRAVVKRPLVPIVLWVVLLAVAVPFLSHLGSVTTNSQSTLPSSAPSAQAAAKFGALFPSATGGSSATLVVYGPNVTGPAGQGVLQNVTAALLANRSLRDVTSVDSVYTSYAGFLAGQVLLASGAIAGAQAAHPSLTASVNATSGLLWGPPSLFFANWASLVANATGPWSSYNAPAYNQTASALGSNATALAVLNAFYAGYNGSATGFNGSAAQCAQGPTLSDARACADGAARANEAPLLPTILPGPTATALGQAVLGGLAIENATAWPSVETVAATVLGGEVNFTARWIVTVWNAFPSGVPSSAQALAWANGTVAASTLSTEPIPVPLALRAGFVNAAGTASLIQVSFSVADDATDASGAHPVYDDLSIIDAIAQANLASSDPTVTIRELTTGPAPLDQLTNQAVEQSLALVLPLTVGLLLAISMLYFRSPLAPLVTFGGLGIALVLGLGGTVLLGTLVEHVDSTALTLEEVFVLGVGTDYSIFLVARYREGLVHGLSSEEAIVASVTWAGQSVATSGSTAIIVTLALAFSGVALLAQWGMVLSLAILITMLLSLTMVPACLKLIGPRIFWPTHGERFARQSAKLRARVANEETYFYRAARATHRRPKTIAGAIVLVSIPLVAVALTVPLSYNFYGQLPAGHPATDGLAQLDTSFGPGFAVPSYALVSFAGPLVGAGNVTNASEFTDLAALTALASATGGIATVRSPVGPYGASLAEWLGLASLPLATRANLLGTLSGYVGTDGRTVLLSLQPDSPGLSEPAVHALDAARNAFTGYQATHPNVASVEFGGGAPTIRDLAAQTNLATEVMLLAVTVGLVVVLMVVLRSWIIAVMAVTTIGLSIAWAWALTSLVFSGILGFPIFFYVRTLLFMLVLGLGIDYNIFVLTRVREERARGRSSSEAAVEAVGRTGGIITAAAVILASAFAALYVGEFTLIRAIGFSVAIAVVLDAMVVRTYLVPSLLQLIGDRVWTLSGRRPRPTTAPTGDAGATPPT